MGNGVAVAVGRERCQRRRIGRQPSVAVSVPSGVGRYGGLGRRRLGGRRRGHDPGVADAVGAGVGVVGGVAVTAAAVGVGVAKSQDALRACTTVEPGPKGAEPTEKIVPKVWVGPWAMALAATTMSGRCSGVVRGIIEERGGQVADLDVEAEGADLSAEGRSHGDAAHGIDAPNDHSSLTGS
jgi:hypothetical protein